MFGKDIPKFRNCAIMLLVVGFLCYYLFCYMGAFMNAGKVPAACLVLCVFVLVAMVMMGILARKPAYDSEKAAKARGEV